MATVDTGVVVMDAYIVRIRDDRQLLLDTFEFIIEQRIPSEHSAHNGNGTGFFVFDAIYKRTLEKWLRERLNQ